MLALPPFIVYGPARLSDEERKAKLSTYETYLEKLDTLKPIF
jgi:putative NADPH-quinone reductase